MRGILLLLIVVNLFSFSSYATHFSEIMYAPIQGDEWIELYFNESYNISELSLEDNLNTDEIGCCLFDSECNLTVKTNSYVLILERDFNFSFYYFDLARVYCVDDNSLGNGLGNEEDELSIWWNGTCLDNITYNQNIGAYKNNLSLSFNGTELVETFLSPGFENNFTNLTRTDQVDELDYLINLSMSVYINDVAYVGILYDDLFKINNYFDDPIEVKVNYSLFNSLDELIIEGNFTALINNYKYANTGLIEFNNSGNYTLCGYIDGWNISACKNISVFDLREINCSYTFNSSLDENIYQNEEKVYMNFSVSTNDSYPYIIEYWIEDLFGNIIKNKVNSSNDNTKTFTPDIGEQDSVYFFKSRLYTLCLNENQDVSNSILFVIKNQKSDHSKLTIDEVFTGSDNYARFGEEVRAKINVYKGNSTKNSVKFYIEDKNNQRVSNTYSMNFYKNYFENEITIFVKLDDNCNNKYDDGYYYYVLEGLDEFVREKFKIYGKVASHCPTVKKSSKSSTSTYVAPIISKGLVYEFFVPTTFSNEAFINISIINDDAYEHDLKIHSYIYRGSKSYSGERENNMIESKILSGSKLNLKLLNEMINYTEDGEYKLKIKIYEDDKKTPKEHTSTIYYVKDEVQVTDENVKLKSNSKDVDENVENSSSNLITGNVVGESIYESKNALMKNALYPVFLGLLVLIAIGLMFIKEKNN